MRIYPYIAFYISDSFYVDKLIDYDELIKMNDKELLEIVDEIIINFKSTDKFNIRITRDGMILLNINELETKMISWNDRIKMPNYTIHNDIKVWNDYIEYLNAFIIILDSHITLSNGHSFLEINEITKQDVMRAYYMDVSKNNHKFQGCQGAFPFSNGMDKYTNFRTPKKEVFVNMTKQNRVISKNILLETIKIFDQCINNEVLIKILSSLSRSITQYKEGNHETSILFSWFIIESIISNLWDNHLDNINQIFDNGKKRINKDRKKSLINLNIRATCKFKSNQVAGFLL